MGSLRVLIEGLTANQTREFVTRTLRKGADNSFSDHAFGGSRSRKRVTIPLSPPFSPHEKTISKAVTKLGFTPHDYHAGLAKDRHGREVKIGKILGKAGKHKLLAKFNNDPARAQSQAGNDLQVVISRHAGDIIGQSENCPWKSCMSFGGRYHHSVYQDVRLGTHVAYLTRKGDHKARKPLARISLKPHNSTYSLGDSGRVEAKGHKILRPEDSVYGNASHNFASTVADWADKHFPSKHVGYSKASGLYDDDGNTHKEYITKDHLPSLLKSGGKGVDINTLAHAAWSSGHKYNDALYSSVKKNNPGIASKELLASANLSSKLLTRVVRKGQLGLMQNDRQRQSPRRDRAIDDMRQALGNWRRGDFSASRPPAHIKAAMAHPESARIAVTKAPFSGLRSDLYVRNYHRISHPVRSLPDDAVYKSFIKAKSTPVADKFTTVSNPSNINHVIKTAKRGSKQHLGLAVRSVGVYGDKHIDDAFPKVVKAVVAHGGEDKQKHLNLLAGDLIAGDAVNGYKDVRGLARHWKPPLPVKKFDDTVMAIHGIAMRLPDNGRAASAFIKNNSTHPDVPGSVAFEFARRAKAAARSAGALEGSGIAHAHPGMIRVAHLGFKHALNRISQEIKDHKGSPSSYVFSHLDDMGIMHNLHNWAKDGHKPSQALLKKHKLVSDTWLSQRAFYSQ